MSFTVAFKSTTRVHFEHKPTEVEIKTLQRMLMSDSEPTFVDLKDTTQLFLEGSVLGGTAKELTTIEQLDIEDVDVWVDCALAYIYDEERDLYL